MTKQICFTASDELAVNLNNLAEKTQKSRSELIELLLKAALRREVNEALP